MFLSALRPSKSRPDRPTTDRRARRRLAPLIEGMERRELLTTYITASSATVTQGATGTNTMNFTVKLATGPSAVPVSVSYQEADGTAKAGLDYIATSGTVTFAPGQTLLTIPVTTLPDPAAQTNLGFTMLYSNPVNATLLTQKAGGAIIENNQPVAPSLSIQNVRQDRGLSGSEPMTFTVALNAAQPVPITVTATTADITAVAGVDYVASSQVLTIPAGQTSALFTVTIFGTSTPGPNKLFAVRLSNASVPIGTATAYGTLIYGA